MCEFCRAWNPSEGRPTRAGGAMTAAYGECVDEWAIARGDAGEDLFRMRLRFGTLLEGQGVR
jgi:hypothetical protein